MDPQFVYVPGLSTRTSQCQEEPSATTSRTEKKTQKSVDDTIMDYMKHIKHRKIKSD